MQQAAPKAATPAPAIPQTPSVSVPGPDGRPIVINVPITQQDVDVLLSRRSELSTQLNSATGRRNDLARQLRSARSGADQAGIESRLLQLDGRLVSIENELGGVGRALSAAPSGLLQGIATTAPPSGRFGPLTNNQITGLSVVGIIFVGAPLVISMAMIAMKRFGRPPVVPQIPKDVSDRLERMEQGIEAVALEVERIGEGQRFVTQLMNDRAQRAALPEGVPRS
jgi:hypothetical protein